LPKEDGDRLEALIVAADDAGWAALARSLQERCLAPAHSFPPRCIIGALRRADLDSLRGVPGVRVIVDQVPESELLTLPEPLRLAAAAWNERLRSRAEGGRARGRGESWDAPGFLPPDPPAAVRESLRRRESEAAKAPSRGPGRGDGDEPEKG
jgi:hypothetical protein